MDEYKKVRLEDVLGKEIDIFNLSWNTLNKNCKLMEEYSTFIQNYLYTMNQYYMSLT